MPPIDPQLILTACGKTLPGEVAPTELLPIMISAILCCASAKKLIGVLAKDAPEYAKSTTTVGRWLRDTTEWLGAPKPEKGKTSAAHKQAIREWYIANGSPTLEEIRGGWVPEHRRTQRAGTIPATIPTTNSSPAPAPAPKETPTPAPVNAPEPAPSKRTTTQALAPVPAPKETPAPAPADPQAKAPAPGTKPAKPTAPTPPIKKTSAAVKNQPATTPAETPVENMTLDQVNKTIRDLEVDQTYPDRFIALKKRQFLLTQKFDAPSSSVHDWYPSISRDMTDKGLDWTPPSE